jgi:hypothetical protein
MCMHTVDTDARCNSMALAKAIGPHIATSPLCTIRTSQFNTRKLTKRLCNVESKLSAQHQTIACPSPIPSTPPEPIRITNLSWAQRSLTAKSRTSCANQVMSQDRAKKGGREADCRWAARGGSTASNNGYNIPNTYKQKGGGRGQTMAT